MAASAAESPVWIVLGSYQSVGNAEAARREPGMDVMEPLQVRAFDTAAGRRHRLLLGPFETRGQATAKLAEVRSDGHAGAWLLVGDGGD
ncbi:MAG: SPOR domain-containing protein, partial [Gammaproteobacteria bacterium]|nr:SPOR domain-containing protein [Gammaproteobacteria bacterium]